MDWTIQKMCTDMHDYELSAEREKRTMHCEQNHESWKWSVAYHGSIIASGSAKDMETAQSLAIANVPIGN